MSKNFGKKKKHLSKLFEKKLFGQKIFGEKKLCEKKIVSKFFCVKYISWLKKITVINFFGQNKFG